MDFKDFSAINHERWVSPEGYNNTLKHSVNFWLGRVATGLVHLNMDAESPEEFQETAAELFINFDLMATSMGFELSEAVLGRFNAQSETIGYPNKLLHKPNHEPPVPFASLEAELAYVFSKHPEQTNGKDPQTLVEHVLDMIHDIR